MKSKEKERTFPFIQLTQSAAETEKMAEDFGRTLQPNTLLLLIGGLGAGKTAFVRGLARGLKIFDPTEIHSPTFTLINEYSGEIPLFHADLYRLNSLNEIENLGLEDYFHRGGVTAIEWADHCLDFWPKQAIKIQIDLISLNERKIVISS